MGTKCTSCGHENLPGVRFCARCAQSLANVCLACGFENPAGFKFCGQCGANLSAAQFGRASEEDLRRLRSYIPAHLVEKMSHQGARMKGERRSVTVLFLDISGFTSLSESLDPEDVYSIMDDVFKSFVEQIYRYEGTVDKFTGDGLMAIFGAPVMHENDAERAVRAALDMQQALTHHNHQLEERYGIELWCRIGINTGDVVVGGLGSDLRLDYTVMGDTVNVASRLEKAAERGTILVSEAVFRATEALFEYEAQGEMTLKGRTAPVSAYRVRGERAVKGRTRGLPGLEAPLVGRQRELEKICSATQGGLQQGRGHIILVTGPAGIGKSRVTAEWRSWLSTQGVALFQGNSYSHTTSIGLWAIRDMLRGLFSLREHESLDESRRKIRQRLIDLLGEDVAAVLPYIQYLLSPDLVEPEYEERIVYLTPAELRQQIFLAMREMLLSHARSQPLAIILEDIHWMDRPSLDMILFLLGLVEVAPIFFYGISRPDEGLGIKELSALAGRRYSEHLVHVNLGPLAPEEANHLLDVLLAMPDLSADIRRLIPERAEGNPFYLEEIIRMLIERGVIQQDADGRWHGVGDNAGTFEVPRTLQGLILTRLDSLDEAFRDVMQCASVVGRTFPQRVLERVVGGPQVLEQSLAALQESGLIHPESQREEPVFSFHHALTHEAVYDTLLSRRKRDLHRTVGMAIEDLYAPRLDEQVELLAHHYYLGEVPDKALGYLMRAGLQSAGRYANDEAVSYLERALSLREKAHLMPEQYVQIHVGLGDVKGFLGQYDQALMHYQDALQWAGEKEGQVPKWRVAEILRKASRSWERKGRYGEAESRLQQVLSQLENAEASEELLERARTFNDLGWVAFRQGQLESAEQWTDRALQELGKSGSWQDIAAAYNRLSGISYQKGEWKLAADYALRGLRLREQIGYTYGLAMSYNNLSVIHMAAGNWVEGIRYAEKSLELKQRMGDVEGMGISFNNLGTAYKDQRNLQKAHEYLMKSLSTAIRINNANLLASTYSNLGQVALLHGDIHEAWKHFEDSLRVANSSGSKDQIAEALWLLVEAGARSGNMEQAKRYIEEAEAIAGEIGSRAVLALSERSRAHYLRMLGLGAEAVKSLEVSLEHFTDLRNRLEIGRTYYLLGQAQAEIGDRTSAVENVRTAMHVFESLGAEHDSQQARRQLITWGVLEQVADAAGKSTGDAIDSNENTDT